jgi:hypothetical protein
LISRALNAADADAIREALRAEHPIEVLAAGTSMRPEIPDGARLNLCAPNQIRLGDIVLFTAGDRLVAHRVIRRDPKRVLTIGDSCASPDAPIPRERILATVRSVRIGSRSFDCSAPFPRCRAFILVATAWLRLTLRRLRG